MNQKQFEFYINKLFSNAPTEFKQYKGNPLHIDIIFEGGLFNGGYLLGVALFLKYLEKKAYIVVDRISGTSIGSIIGLLYLTNNLDLAIDMYKEIYKDFKRNVNIGDFDKILESIKDSTEIYCKKPFKEPSLLQGKLFITYHNVKKGQQITRSCYKNIDDVLESIKKSCFIPHITYNSHLYKEKYIDGLYPHIFPVNNTDPCKRILYVNIHTFDKVTDMFSVKNEKTNAHRILSGILDFNLFLIKQRKTNMCSYVNNWSLYDKAVSYMFCGCGKIIFYIFCVLYFIYHLIYKILGIFITKKDVNVIFYHTVKIFSVFQKNAIRFLCL